MNTYDIENMDCPHCGKSGEMSYNDLVVGSSCAHCGEWADAEKLPDTITITWSIDDVKSLDDTLTSDQAREVLQQVEKGQEFAAQGIGWSTIQDAIDAFKINKAGAKQ